MGADDTLYVSYPDPQDGYVKIAIVKLAEGEKNVEGAGDPQK